MIITDSTVKSYVEESVLPYLPFKAEFVDAEQVTKHSYVNNIYQVTLDTDQGRAKIYLRQALDHIRVDPPAKVPPERIFYEERVLRFLSKIFEEEITPRVLHSDSDNFTLVLSDVGQNSSVLVDELARGQVHPETGTALGHILGTMHGETWGGIFELDETSNEHHLKRHFFGRLKQAAEIDPQATQSLIDESQKAEKSFVAGDFASKNILIRGEGIRFVDLERSFIGDPAFDIGFLIGHYLVEMGNKPQLQSDIETLANLLMKAYTDRMQRFGIDSSAIDQIEDRAIKLSGATILYRLFGRAKAGQIEDESRTKLKEFGLALLRGNYHSYSNAITSF